MKIDQFLNEISGEMAEEARLVRDLIGAISYGSDHLEFIGSIDGHRVVMLYGNGEVLEHSPLCECLPTRLPNTCL